MSINKNISINTTDCRSCNHIATVNISPTLLTDREVTYAIHSHGFGINSSPSIDYTELYAKIENALTESKTYTDKRMEIVMDEVDDFDGRLYKKVRYEILNKPEGTIVDYRDKEIRIMCPADTKWSKQNVGANGDPNVYYVGFYAYAPEGAVSFKESLDTKITDNTMYYFEGNAFAGIDSYDRKYSVCWLGVAYYDTSKNEWVYYGANSTEDKYIGWYYSVEWYNANGKIINTDCIRISLSNESCHSTINPSYANILAEEAARIANEYTDEQIVKILETYDDVTDEDIENLFK